MRPSPEGYRTYLLNQGVPARALDVAPAVAAAWGPLRAQVARAAGARRRRDWPYDDAWPYHAADGLGVVPLPTGAPAAALLLDQLFAWGGQRLIASGIAGSLVPAAGPGTVVVATAALAGDGTSRRYALGHDGVLEASPALAMAAEAALREAGLAVRTGTVWTVDAPFRSERGALDAARSAGAIATDMETAAVYAVAAARGAAACSVLVVSDCLWDEWRPAFGTPAVRGALDAVARALPVALGAR